MGTKKASNGNLIIFDKSNQLISHIDSKRLDWLEKNFKKDNYMDFSSFGKTLRDVIDESMEKEKL